MVSEAAVTYSAVFAPELFVFLCGLCVIGYEWWRAAYSSLAGLVMRLGVLLAGWAVGFAVYKGVPALLSSVPTWGPDFTGSAGLGLGVLCIWWAWRRLDWGEEVPGFSLALVVATVPHLAVTPVWDVSSHVLYAVVPAGYLVLVDRRFVPLGLVALGMVLARPLAGAHTWAQSVGGLLLGVAVLWAYDRHAADRGDVDPDWDPLG